jgi:hypothetical protein
VSAWAERDALRAKLKNAREREATLDRARKAAASAGAREEAELEDYYTRVGEGALEPNVEEEKRLGEALMFARQGLIPKSLTILHEVLGDGQGGQVGKGGGQVDLTERLTDPAAEARYRGAVKARENLEQELRQFVARNVGVLLAEKYPEAEAMGAECAAARQAYRRIGNRIEAFVQELNGVFVEGGLDGLLGEVPANPVPQDLPEAVLPFPESFLPRSDLPLGSEVPTQ